MKLAFENVQELYQSEQLTDLGLEEVEYNEAAASWLITVGFSRPWDKGSGDAFAAISGVSRLKPRSFKVVKIKDGKMVSLRDRSKAQA